MEEMTLANDITVFYVTAKSFPHCVLQAHQEVRRLAGTTGNRRFFGLSRPENGVIIYKAGAEEITAGEAEALNCDTVVIKKGRYISKTINGFKNDVPAIEKTFREMVSHPDLDLNGYCIEWYLNDDDVKCMVRLNDQDKTIGNNL